MPVLFNKVQRGNPQDPTDKKWYAVLKTISMISQKEVAKQVADETTLNPKEAEMAMEQLLKILVRNLLASQSVQLGDWGSFHLTCNSLGFNTKEAVTAHAIKNLNIRFSPGKALKEELKDATFLSAEELSNGK